MQVSAVHIANLLDYASYKGISESALKEGLENKELDLCHPDSRITTQEFIAVYKMLFNATNDQYFGLHYGCYLNIKALGFIGELSLNTSSIEQAVFVLQGYLKTTIPLVTLSTEEDGEVYELQLDCSIEDRFLNTGLLDTVFCFIYRELKLMLDDSCSLELLLPYKELDEYSDFLSVVVREEKKHTIRLDKAVLNSEINKKRVKEIEMLLPQFLKMLDSNLYKGFSLQMRNMILNMCSPELPSFEQVSKQFPLSVRTIQRKLTKEGYSFRKISEDIKRELSYYLTKGKQIKTQDIASILGYSESSAYLHAVKRWEQLSDY